MKKVLLYYNPKSGNGVITSHLDDIIKAFLKKKRLVIPLRANNISVINDFLADIDQDEYEKILVAGGDGTINTLVAAMVAHKVDIPIAILPVGTANDFAYHFDIPTNIDDSLEIALKSNYASCDVGMCGDKPFINVMACGHIVDVSQKTDPLSKNTLGTMAYYLRGIADISKLKPIPVKVKTYDRDISTDMFAMLVMNGTSAGGFNNLVKKGSTDDGVLDVIIVKKFPLVAFVPFMIGVIAGNIIDSEFVEHFRTDSLYVESSKEIVIDTDGENAGYLPVNVSVLKNRLRISVASESGE